jgi:hypothetical protein
VVVLEFELFSPHPQIYLFIFSIFYYIILYWGYIMTFTKVLALYHSWIYPIHHSPLFSLPLFLEYWTPFFSNSWFSVFFKIIIVYVAW